MGQDKRIARSQRAIHAAFLDLMTKKSFEEITTSDIIEASGYSRGTFYTHYTDKYDLAAKIMENEIDGHVEVIVGTIKQRKKIATGGADIYEPAYRLFEHVNDNRVLYQLILNSKMPGYTLDSFIDSVNERFKREVDVESRQWPEDLSRDFYFYVNSYMFLVYIKYWERHNFSLSVEYMAKQVTCMINREKPSSVFINQQAPPRSGRSLLANRNRRQDQEPKNQ
jgi:AcrR family transcriptional regulator